MITSLYQLKMSECSRIFWQLAQRVKESGKYQQILSVQNFKYHLQPYKLQGINIDIINKIYTSTINKYQHHPDLNQDMNNWTDSERRVFIWFIVCYEYFLQQDGQQLNQQKWDQLSKVFFDKKPQFLKFQHLSLIKPVGKIQWTIEEDQLLLEIIRSVDEGKWNQISLLFFYKSEHTLFKSPKHCRQRWQNHLDDKKMHGNWTVNEDIIIFQYVAEQGRRWCKIVPLLKNQRTQHMIKNRFNSILNKQRQGRFEREQQLIIRILKLLKKQALNAQKRRSKKAVVQQPIQNLQNGLAQIKREQEKQQIEQKINDNQFEEENNHEERQMSESPEIKKFNLQKSSQSATSKQDHSVIKQEDVQMENSVKIEQKNIQSEKTQIKTQDINFYPFMPVMNNYPLPNYPYFHYPLGYSPYGYY